MSGSIHKVYRFFLIYGLRKTIFKVIGRSRNKLKFLRYFSFKRRNKFVGLIGCGQFGFSTIGHSLTLKRGNVFLKAFDIDAANQSSFERFFSIPTTSTFSEIINDEKISLVYVASNHASHSRYTIEILESGKTVYCEKPICTSFDQFDELLTVLRLHHRRFYVGYNRPFSPFISFYKRHSSAQKLAPITLNCMVFGHKIGEDHWYRAEEEGSRICGNVGHWLDLAVHLIGVNCISDYWNVSVSYADKKQFDDNISISLVSERGDLISIMLSSRTEPYEGINENICIQQGTLICKIDDFRSMHLYDGPKLYRKRLFHKDVGHNNAINQPFSSQKRDVNEVLISTYIMLHVFKIVSERKTYCKLSLSDFKKNSLI